VSKIAIEQCCCGSSNCCDYWLVGIGKFMQGSGFTKEDAQRIADLLNQESASKRPMTDLNKLADELEALLCATPEIGGANPDFALVRFVRRERNDILSALRDAGKMRGALEGIVADGELEKRSVPGPDDHFGRGVRAARTAAANIAKAALKTEGE
jgi:hypothetical protein